jgi:DNA-binding MarR family transcriptional regulator
MAPVPIARLLSAATRLTVEQLNAGLAERGFGDLRPAHGYALNAIGPGTTTARLAADLGMTKQGAAKLVGTLERAGYLERGAHAGDARVRPLTLTPRGADLLRAAEEVQRGLEAHWAQVLGGADAATLRRALETLAGGGDAPPRPIW